MDKKALEVKRDEITAAFDTQAKIKAEAASEQLRLQGEYRLVNDLLDELQEGKKK